MHDDAQGCEVGWCYNFFLWTCEPWFEVDIWRVITYSIVEGKDVIFTIW
jgi:hypothetical protein